MLVTAMLSEFVGTTVMMLLGCGVSANVGLRRSKGYRGGWALISLGWGLAVYLGVTVASRSGAQLNPAVTLGLVLSGVKDFAPGVPDSLVTVLGYVTAQFAGCFAGALLAWLVYKQQLDAEPQASAKLGVFATTPAIRSWLWNGLAESIATGVLVFVAIAFGRHSDTAGLASLGALPVALLVIALIAGLGGPTGAALNPARDLGPRLVHALVPIRGKGPSDWAYAWVPVIAPLVGGAVAGVLAGPLLP